MARNKIKKDPKDILVVGLKKTETRPALWVKLGDMEKFSKYMETEGIGSALIIKKQNLIIDVLMKKTALCMLPEKEWDNLKKKLLKIDGLKL